jgi:hypothetical protein
MRLQQGDHAVLPCAEGREADREQDHDAAMAAIRASGDEIVRPEVIP